MTADIRNAAVTKFRLMVGSAIVLVTFVAAGLTFQGCSGIFTGVKSSLHEAAERNDLKTIKLLIAWGTSPDVTYNEPGNLHEGPGIHGITPLMVAAESGHLASVRLLIDAGANIYAQTWRPGREGYDYTAFDYAVEGGHPDVVKYIWEKSNRTSFKKRISINLNIAYNRFCSRQISAASQELVVFLLDNVADAKLASDTLWRISDRDYCMDAIRFLLNRGITPSPNAVVTAAKLGLTEIVSLYRQRGADINAYGRSSYTYLGAMVTPLIAAAGAGNFAMVKFLLSVGADPNLQDTEGRSALIAAMAEGGCSRIDPRCEERHEVMKVLLKHGARADIRDRFHKSAFDYIDRYPDDPYNSKKRAIMEGVAQ